MQILFIACCVLLTHMFLCEETFSTENITQPGFSIINESENIINEIKKHGLKNRYVIKEIKITDEQPIMMSIELIGNSEKINAFNDIPFWTNDQGKRVYGFDDAIYKISDKSILIFKNGPIERWGYSFSGDRIDPLVIGAVKGHGLVYLQGKGTIKSKNKKTVTLPESATSKNNPIVIVQSELIKRGYNPGPMDGVWGSKTENALKEFQSSNNIDVTEFPNEETLTLLGIPKNLNFNLKPDEKDKNQNTQFNINFLVDNQSNINASGKVTLKGTNEKKTRTIIDIDSILEIKKDNVKASQILKFYPGVEHTFIEKVFLPGSVNSYTLTIDIEVEALGDAGIGINSNGYYIFSKGKIKQFGEVLMDFKSDTPTIEIDSDKDNPLVFLLTAKGYKYISGKGSIRLPNGTVTRF